MTSDSRSDSRSHSMGPRGAALGHVRGSRHPWCPPHPAPSCRCAGVGRGSASSARSGNAWITVMPRCVASGYLFAMCRSGSAPARGDGGGERSTFEVCGTWHARNRRRVQPRVPGCDSVLLRRSERWFRPSTTCLEVSAKSLSRRLTPAAPDARWRAHARPRVPALRAYHESSRGAGEPGR